MDDKIYYVQSEQDFYDSYGDEEFDCLIEWIRVSPKYSEEFYSLLKDCKNNKDLLDTGYKMSKLLNKALSYMVDESMVKQQQLKEFE